MALPDVVAYLSVATWAAGEGSLVASPVYAPGFGLLLAPVAWVTEGAGALHTAALIANGLAHALSVVVAVELARRLVATHRVTAGDVGRDGSIVDVRATRWVCALTAAFAALFAPMVAASTIGWPEPVLALVVGASALGLARARSGLIWLFAAAALVGLAPAFHPRLVVLIGALVVSVAASPSLRRGWRWAAGGATLGGALTAGAYLFTGLWPTARGAEAAEAADGWLAVAAGQMVALAAATFGLGLLALVAPLWLRRDDGCWPVAMFLSAGAASVVLVGALALAGSDRADVFAYGRYVEPWAVPLVAVGLTALLTVGARVARSCTWSPRIGLVGSAVVVGGGAVVVALTLAPDGALRPALTVMTLSAGVLWVLASSANVVGVVVLAAVIVGVSLTFAFFATGPPVVRAHRAVRAGCAALAVTLAVSLTVGSLVRNWNELGEARASAARQMADARQLRHQLTAGGPLSARSPGRPSGARCVAHDRSGIGGDVPSYVSWLYRFELSEFEHRFVDVAAGEQPCSQVVVAGSAFAQICDATRLVPRGYAFLINSPPSTGSTAPVMYWLAGKQKLSVPCATSSGSA